MVEPISLSIAAKETAAAAVTVSKESIAEIVKESTEAAIREITENVVNESAVQEMLPTIKESSLDALKIKNESIAKNLYENRVNQIEMNRINGALREQKAAESLLEKFPESEGFNHLQECYLRNENGTIMKDNLTGEARRIDHMIEKNGNIVDSYEIISKTAPK